MNILIKRTLIFVLAILSLFALPACFADYNLKLDFKKESYYIYENEDKTIRFELSKIYEFRSKLYIKNNDELFIFKVDYSGYHRSTFRVTVEQGVKNPDHESPYYLIDPIYVIYSFEFKKKSENNFLFFWVDKDFIYLKYEENSRDPKEEHFLKNIKNETLYRIYDELPNPLTWYQNYFESKVNDIKFVNKRSNEFYAKNAIKGKIKGENVIIYFTDENNKSNNEFKIKKADEPHEIILSGTYKIDEYNIILINDGSYDDFPDEITLEFGKLTQEEAYAYD